MKDEMTKLPETTPDLTELNTEKVKELFPQAVTEGKIDFDTLKSLLGDEVDGYHEKYQFTWHGKSKAIKLAQSPSSATLRPSKDDSKNWDTTENLYIEGDNLEVLKQLQKTYFGKIKIIYIDPPYNTGGDFVYKDDFKDTIKNYKEQTNQSHKANAETSGRYHTDWLNMMYPRLMLAKNLLSDDGVIFVSIDDNEVFNLMKVCNEIFGENNFVTAFIWEKKKKPSFLHSKVGKLNDYILCYSKNSEHSDALSVETTTKGKKYPLNNAGNNISILTFPKDSVSFSFDNARIMPQDMSEGSIQTELLDLLNVEGSKNLNSFRLKGEFRYSQKKLDEIIENNEVITISKVPFRPNHIKTGGEVKKMKNFLTRTHYNMETNEDGTNQLIDLFGSDIFDNPKPIKLVEYLCKSVTYNDPFSICLDFFSGSATTAHAVMKLNAEDGGNRKFIMVQLPEPTDEKSEAHKAGYENICEIGKERIRRAGKQIQEEMTKDGKDSSSLDVGFKVFKLDSTNIKEWDSSQTLKEPTLLEYADIFKDGRTQEDVLYEILLKYGVFNMPVKEIQLNDKTAYDVAEGNTLICLADDINEEDIQVIGRLKPQNVIFKESGFKDDNVKLNAIYTLEKQGVEDIQAI